MKIRIVVRVFGHFKDLTESEQFIELEEGSTPRDAARWLASLDSRLDGLERICRIGINETYSSFDVKLADGDDLAFIPPMSGG